MHLSLNKQKAIEGGTFNNRITESNAYDCEITKAELVTSREGTKGLELAVKAADGATADYLQLWLVKKDGTELFGMKATQAILACLRLRDCPEGIIKVRKYDKQSGAMVDNVEAPGYPALMGKKIGLLLQRELFTKNDGADAERMTIIGAYEVGTHFTAAEILGGVVNATAAEKAVQFLRQKPVRDSRKKQPSMGAAIHAAAQSHGTDFTPFDDDIPF